MKSSVLSNTLCLVMSMFWVDILSAQEANRERSYNLRESEPYQALDETSRNRLETVVADFEKLERSLESFMKDHEGAPPEKLEELVPTYIDRLPQDPFSRCNEQIPEHLSHFQRSLDGRGYLYLHRPTGLSIKSYEPLEFEPSPGAWQIQSVGLRDFPLRHQRSNPGLIRTQGYWGRYQLDIF